ncbi:MAG: 5-formyltetrahydrofolate cyclo-ligase [Coriobacteriia bacterium]
MPHSDDFARSKSTLRLKTRAARRAVTPEVRRAASEAVARAVLALPEMCRVNAVAAYGAMPEEIDADPLIEALWDAGVRVALPRVVDKMSVTLHWHERGRTLCRGAYDLREPCADAPLAAPAEIEVFVIPGVAFDDSCRRLGMGGGYYDRLIAALEVPVPVVGIAFDEQMVPAVPCCETDRWVDVLVTQNRIVRRT